MLWSFRGSVGGRIQLDDDRLHRARCRRTHHPLTLRIVGVRVVSQRLLSLQPEHIRRERNALRISQTPIQVNHNSHQSAPLCVASKALSTRPFRKVATRPWKELASQDPANGADATPREFSQCSLAQYFCDKQDCWLASEGVAHDLEAGTRHPPRSADQG